MSLMPLLFWSAALSVADCSRPMSAREFRPSARAGRRRRRVRRVAERDGVRRGDPSREGRRLGSRPPAADSRSRARRRPRGSRKRRDDLVDDMYDQLAHKCATTGRRFATRKAGTRMPDARRHARTVALKKAETKPPRRWCVDRDQWVAGARRRRTPSPRFRRKEKAERGGSGTRRSRGCPRPWTRISPRARCQGNPSETFWHAELEEWHYRGAVKLEEDVGGVPRGSLGCTAKPKTGDEEDRRSAEDEDDDEEEEEEGGRGGGGGGGWSGGGRIRGRRRSRVSR